MNADLTKPDGKGTSSAREGFKMVLAMGAVGLVMVPGIVVSWFVRDDDVAETRGLEPVVAPTIELRPALPGGALDEAASAIDTYAWAVVTSTPGADALAAGIQRAGGDLGRVRLAAVGAATAESLAAQGGREVFLPSRAAGAALAEELPVTAGDRVLLARADAADGALPARLRERGARVDEVVAYHTVEAPETARRPLRAAPTHVPVAARAPCARGRPSAGPAPPCRDPFDPDPLAGPCPPGGDHCMP